MISEQIWRLILRQQLLAVTLLPLFSINHRKLLRYATLHMTGKVRRFLRCPSL